MSQPRDNIEEQALDWLIRQREPAFDEWEAFADWLAADPEHAAIYHAMAAADERSAALFTAPSPAPIVRRAEAITPRRRIGRRSAIGLATAAALLAITSYGLLGPGSSPYAVETPPGVHRTVTLADGTRIEMNGGTRLRLDREDSRLALLDHGEAAFTVTHDADNPFVVKTGDATLRDVGTIFNVLREAGVTQVAVAEGAVLYNPDGEAVRLDAGRTLRAVDGEDHVVLGSTAPADMAGWRQGRLVYDGAPLASVASDLSRNLGLRVAASPEVAARPFRGIIMLDRDRDRLLAQLGPLLDVDVKRDQQGWTLTARTRAQP
ncbi:iron dicitrate transport regulator FecR [Sphingomonas oleivorans]|uniref:Iron dicitrate transport regulator FecR n=2 Tax=Sphingomonas oleivorans TaxID=1735121 RepID=A0A2T5FUS4_9SPHN|nr:iron dicitrate transport regulator FecR [Sphingomonas oleivorans]